MKKRFKARIYEAEERQLKGVDISCNIINDMKPPVWFVEFEKRNNARLDNVENRLIKLDNRIDNLVTKNNLKE